MVGRSFVGADERGLGQVFGDKPDLRLIGADDVIDEQVIGAIIA
jgi:hypothetical protein